MGSQKVGVFCLFLLAVTALMLSCVFRGAGSTPKPGPVASITAESPKAAMVTAKSPKSSGPNILLITIDSLRADHLGSYGNPRVRTPNMDALAQNGVRFSLAISQFSQTNPSHASLFTSTYAATHKLKHHGVDKLSESLPTLAEILTNNGYTTAGIYSWPTFNPDLSGLNRGFMTYQGAYLAMPGQDPNNWDRGWDGRADVTTDAALQWLKEKASVPFFLWLHYQDPHYPYTAPPPFDNMYVPTGQDCIGGSWETIDRMDAGELFSKADIDCIVARYDAEISFTDQEIGRVLEALRVANLLDNTMVVVTADHGESLTEHGRWFHPWILYNGVVRVPLIISYPPAVPGHLVVDALARSIDVMPTILELVGIPPPKQAEGGSLWPLIQGQEKGDDRVAFVQVLDDSTIALVTRAWKLIRNNVSGELELYDLKTDPGELNNLAFVRPQQASELEQKLRVWMESHGIRP